MIQQPRPARPRLGVVLVALAMLPGAYAAPAAASTPLPSGAADSALALFDTGAVFPREFSIAWQRLSPNNRPKGSKEESRRAFLQSVSDRKLLVQAVGEHPFSPSPAQQAELDKVRDAMMQNQLFHAMVANLPEPSSEALETLDRRQRQLAVARFITFSKEDRARLWRQRLLTGTPMAAFEEAVAREGAALATIEPARMLAAEQIPDTLATVLWSLRPGQVSAVHMFDGHPMLLHLQDYEPRPDRLGSSENLALRAEFERRQYDRLREQFRQSLALEVGRTFDDETMAFVLAAHLKIPPRSDADSTSGLPTIRPNLPLPVFTAADTGKTIARTRDRRVTLLDYVRFWSAVSSLTRPEIRERAMLEAAVDRVVLDPEILKAAMDQGFDRDPAVLEAIAETREGMVLDAYFAEEVEGKVVMDPKAIHAMWAKDPVHYHDRASLTSSIIVVDRRSLADSLLARLKNGASFAQLARDFSIDSPTAAEGGKAGLQYRGSQRNAGLEDAMFATAVGQLGGPEFTAEGWVLWKIEAAQPEVRRSFEEARAMVERDYLTIESDRLIEARLAELRKRGNLRLFPERIDAAIGVGGAWPE